MTWWSDPDTSPAATEEPLPAWLRQAADEDRALVPEPEFEQAPESWVHVLAGLLLLAAIVWLLVVGLAVLA